MPDQLTAPPPSRWAARAYAAPQKSSRQKAGRTSPASAPVRDGFPSSRAAIPQAMNRAGTAQQVSPS